MIECLITFGPLSLAIPLLPLLLWIVVVVAVALCLQLLFALRVPFLSCLFASCLHHHHHQPSVLWWRHSSLSHWLSRYTSPFCVVMASFLQGTGPPFLSHLRNTAIATSKIMYNYFLHVEALAGCRFLLQGAPAGVFSVLSRLWLTITLCASLRPSTRMSKVYFNYSETDFDLRLYIYWCFNEGLASVSISVRERNLRHKKKKRVTTHEGTTPGRVYTSGECRSEVKVAKFFPSRI